MHKLLPIRVTLDSANRLWLPRFLSERISWLEGTKPKDSWLWLIESGRYRLLADEEVKSDQSLSSLREWILEGRPPNSIRSSGKEFLVLPVQLLPVMITPPPPVWRMVMPRVLSVFADNDKDARDFVLALAADQIEIWSVTALREAVANMQDKSGNEIPMMPSPNTRFEANLMRQNPGRIYEWDVFICHASEDKAEIARPLAEALRSRGLHVWFDEFSLEVGESLRMRIEEGVAACRFGIVILSPRFFEKHWTQRELNGLTSREVNGKKVILPIWHKVTFEDVRDRSPILSDLVAVTTDQGLEKVVEHIVRAMDMRVRL
jgi:hypothetical protein